MIRVAIFSLGTKSFLSELQKCEFLDLIYTTSDDISADIQDCYPKAAVYNLNDIAVSYENDFNANISDEVIQIYQAHKSLLFAILNRRDFSSSLTLHEMGHYIMTLLSICHNIYIKHTIDMAIFHVIPHEIVEYCFYVCAKFYKTHIVMMDVHITPYSAHFFCNDIGSADYIAIEYQKAKKISDIMLPQEFANIYDSLTAKDILLPYYEVQNRKHAAMLYVTKVQFYKRLFEISKQIVKLSCRKFQAYAVIANLHGNTIGRRSVTPFVEAYHHFFLLFRVRQITNFLYQREQKDINFTEKYIYFPLQYQPEATTVPLGGFFGEQFFAIKVLSASLPDGWKLFIKEHPSQYILPKNLNIVKQVYMMRSKAFYENILSLPNVTLVSRTVDNTSLIDNSQIIATITGTAGLEGYARGKSIIVFGRPWYQHLEGLFMVSSVLECTKAIQKIQNIGKPDNLYNLKSLLYAYSRVSFPLYQHTDSNIDYSVLDASKSTDFRTQLLLHIRRQFPDLLSHFK